jgi:hypothetical protein
VKSAFGLLVAVVPLLGCGSTPRAASDARSAQLRVRAWSDCAANIQEGTPGITCQGSPPLPCTLVARGALGGAGHDAAVWTCTVVQDGEPVPVALVVTDDSGITFADGASEYGAIASVEVMDAVRDEPGQRIDELAVEWADEERTWVLYRRSTNGELRPVAEILTFQPGGCGWSVEPAGNWPTTGLTVQATYEDEPLGEPTTFSWSAESERFVGEPPACVVPDEAGVALEE